MAGRLTVDFRKHSGPTPADDMAAQIITDCGNFTLDFKKHGFCASLLFLQTLGPWFNMFWYSTPFSNDPLWLILFVEGVNDHLLDHCQVSSVPHYCGFKEQEILRIYNVWMRIYWNSNVNILIFWDKDFWLSLAVSSNHQNENKKKLLKCLLYM